MEMVAHDPKAAKRVGVPTRVGRDFVQADKGKKFQKGGEMKKPNKLFKGKETYKEELNEAKAIKSGKLTPKQYVMGEKSEEKAYKKGGKTKCYAEGGELDNASQPGAYAGLRAQAQRLKREAEEKANIKGGSPGPERPYSNKFADEGAYAVNTRVKPYTGEPKVSGELTQRQIDAKNKAQAGLAKIREDEASAKLASSSASRAAATPKVATPKPAVKKAAPAPVKRAVSKPSSGLRLDSAALADLKNFRDTVGSEWDKPAVDSGDELPVGADAYRKGGKVKGGNVRGHGAERTGRTRGRFI